MSTTTKKKNVQSVKSEAIVNDAPRTFSEADFPIGTTAHQGDLIMVRIAFLPRSARPRNNRQLADGNTQGSRHVLQSGLPFDCMPEEVSAAIAAACRGTVVQPTYVGPVFSTEKGVANLVHPEHGDHHYRGEMVIAVVFQRNLDAEDRERRVQD